MKRENQLIYRTEFILRDTMEEFHIAILIGFFKAQSMTLKLNIYITVRARSTVHPAQDLPVACSSCM